MSGSKRRYQRVQPELQRDIVEDYQCGVRGHGHIAIARKHGLPVGTVRDVIVRGRAGGRRSRRAAWAQEAEAEQWRSDQVVEGS